MCFGAFKKGLFISVEFSQEHEFLSKLNRFLICKWHNVSLALSSQNQTSRAAALYVHAPTTVTLRGKLLGTTHGVTSLGSDKLVVPEEKMADHEEQLPDEEKVIKRLFEAKPEWEGPGLGF